MHDAASVWLEDVSASSFKICLRELQNFAGVHDDISVVCIIKFGIIHCDLMQYFNLVWSGLIIHSFIHSVSQSESVSQSFIHLVSQSAVIHSFIHSVGRSVGQSVNQSLSTNTTKKRYCRSIIQYLLPHVVTLFH